MLARVLLLLLVGVCACESTALSLGDPNDVNATLMPEIIENTSGDPVTLLLTFEGVTDSTDGNPQDRAVLDADLGPGLVLKEWNFLSNFTVELRILRYAEAPIGVRSVFVRIFNPFGTFLARCELGVFGTP